MPRILVRAAATALAGVVLLGSAACSSAGQATAPVTTGATDTVTAAGTGATGLLTAAQVCTALPAAAAKKLTGLAVSSADPMSDGSAGCAYSSDDSSVQIQVQVYPADQTDQTWTLVSTAPTAKAVSGVGEKAVWDGEGTLYAEKDGRLLQVNGVATQDQAVALADAVLTLL